MEISDNNYVFFIRQSRQKFIDKNGSASPLLLRHQLGGLKTSCSYVCTFSFYFYSIIEIVVPLKLLNPLILLADDAAADAIDFTIGTIENPSCSSQKANSEVKHSALLS